MQRRDLFKLMGASMALGTATVVLETGCQREAPAGQQGFVGPLRKHALPDTVEPAFVFRPLAQPK